MFSIAKLTLIKLKEPAFFIMLLMAMFLGYTSSEMDPLTEQFNDSFIAQIVVAQQGEPVMTSTLFAFSMTVLICIFAGATEIPRDIDSGLIMILISKPLRKCEYLLGKFLGIVALCLIFFLAIEFTIIVGHWVKTGDFYSISSMLRQFLMVFGLFPLAAISVMISCYMQDFSAMVVNAIYLIFGFYVSTIPLIIEMLPQSIAGATSYLLVIYYLFPNFLYFFQPFQNIGLISIALLIYSVSMTSIFLMLANIRLVSRDLI